MSEEIKPALTPQDWERREVDRPPRAITDRNGVLKVHGIGTSVIIPDEFRHPLAALCLDGQSYGFTQDDVELIELFARGDPSEYIRAECRSLANRIAALLQPGTHNAG